jgi:hypothetical protein
VLQESLSVSGGTCSLDASTNDTHVVQAVRHPGKALCSQLILGARGLGSAVVTIQDIGLSPRATTHSLVHCSGAFLHNSLIYSLYSSQPGAHCSLCALITYYLRPRTEVFVCLVEVKFFNFV